MTVLAYTKRGFAPLAGLAAVCVAAMPASAQVMPMPGYATQQPAQAAPAYRVAAQPATQPVLAPPAFAAPAAPTFAAAAAVAHPAYAPATPAAPTTPQPAAQVAAPVAPYAMPTNFAAQRPPQYAPVAAAPVASAQATTPAYSPAPQAYPGPAYAAPNPAYAAPRVADASAAPTIEPVPAIPSVSTPPPVVTEAPAIGSPAGDCNCQTPANTWEGYVGEAAGPGCATGDCATAACGTGDYAYGAPACNIGVGMPAKSRRQWFGGLYYLLLDRVDTSKRQQVAYLTDTAGFGAGDPYYYQPTDAGLFNDDAEFDALHGAEIRFGSTFGPTNPCTCSQGYAWELAYWALDDANADAWLRLSDPVSSTNFNRIYGAMTKAGLRYDLDGSGTTYTDRPGDEYHDNGVPADGDIFANDVRLLAVRVRRRFQAQNLELNFWRFGTPECSSACGAGVLGGVGLGGGGGAGCGDACGDACHTGRPPRRFVFNGLLGVRYFRVDDDLGIDTQFTLVDGAGDPNTGWGNIHTGFPEDEIGVILQDIETNNQLVGFQLGCSMNWLIGCKWNLFADSACGIYGNNAEVYQRIFLGGGGSAAYAESGNTFVSSRQSQTDLAFLGELRAGIGYQVTCNTRLTAAYRFIGVGGLALPGSNVPQSYANAGVVGHIDASDSLILHGLQIGAERSF